jgi:hypothetical protein
VAANLLDFVQQELPRSLRIAHKFALARLEASKPVPDARHIYLAAGFVPGRLYHVVYTTAGAPVIGLGFLATRDFASFLRHELARENPCAGQIRHAYVFGASQSGAYRPSASAKGRRASSATIVTNRWKRPLSLPASTIR